MVTKFQNPIHTVAISFSFCPSIPAVSTMSGAYISIALIPVICWNIASTIPAANATFDDISADTNHITPFFSVDITDSFSSPSPSLPGIAVYGFECESSHRFDSGKKSVPMEKISGRIAVDANSYLRKGDEEKLEQNHENGKEVPEQTSNHYQHH